MTSKPLSNWRMFAKLISAEWRIRDQSSISGFIMTLMSPLLSWCIIYAFLGTAFEHYHENFGIYLLVGLVLWGFFSRSTIAGMAAPRVHREWISSMKVPFWAVVLAPVVAIFGAFCLESLLVLLFVGYLVGLEAVAGFAGYLVASVLLLLISCGISLILAVLNVFIRDTGYLWTIVTRIAFFATPVFYPEAFVGRRISWLQVNPLTHVFGLARNGAGIADRPEIWSVGYAVLFALIVFAVGVSVCHGVKQRVAEVI